MFRRQSESWLQDINQKLLSKLILVIRDHVLSSWA